LDRLPLLDRVVKESMRVLPTVVYNSRTATAACQLQGYDLPAGTVVFYSNYLTHRDPQIYREPRRFLPARWESINPRPHEYMPFNAGTHTCIGISYAIQAIKVFTAVVLSRLRLECVENAAIDRRVALTLGPRRGMPMRVAPMGQAVRKMSVRGDIHEIIDL
jgi:cytochrome P450